MSQIKHLISGLIEYTPASQTDPSVHFYISDAYKGKRISAKLWVDGEFEQEYFFKEFHIEENKSENIQSSQSLLKQSISQLMENLADYKPPEIMMIQNPTKQSQLLLQKYSPQRFSDLLSDERINREVLMWLQVWKQNSQQEQKVYQIFKHNVETPLNLRLSNQIILLAGPPGTGKTTLARVIGQMCGYECIEINASDERTTDKLINRIEMMCNNNSLDKNKQTLIILDEVDGALESESEGAIKKVLDYIYFGNKPTGKRQTKAAAKQSKNKKRNDQQPQQQQKPDKNEKEDEEDEPELANQLYQQQQQTGDVKLFIKRPVIFICNDPYSKGLRELRKKATVYYFKPPEEQRLIQRLKYICQKEGIVIDHVSLVKLCIANNYDIRACLGSLEMVSLNSKYADDQIKLEKSKGILEVLGDVFFTNNNMMKELELQLKQLESNIVLDATFQNYIKVKNIGKKFVYLPNFLNQLCISDILDKDKLKYQFQLAKFINLPLNYFYQNFRTFEKSRIEFPLVMNEMRRKQVQQKIKFYFQKASKDLIDNLTEHLSNSQMKQKHRFSSQIASHLYSIIQPKAEMTIMTQQEKKDLQMAISVMHEFNISIMSHPFIYVVSEKQVAEINFNPQIERLLIFKDIPLRKRINEKSRILMQNVIPSLRKAKMMKNAENQKNQIQCIEKYEEMNKRKKQTPSKDCGGRLVIFRYQEGSNTPINYPLKMTYFYQ